MSTFVQFAVLGLGIGAVYSLLASGIVLIYKGSGTVNFAHGAFAMVGALTAAEFQRNGDSLWLGLLTAVGVGCGLGFATQRGIMELLRDAAPLTRTIATLGVLTALQAAADIRYSEGDLYVNPFLPHSVWKIGSVVIQEDRIVLLAIAAAISVALAIGMRRTRLGLATLAAAANERGASTLGWSPTLLGTLTWTLGGALAGAGGAMIAPIAGLQTSNLVLLVIPALAAALIGRFDSLIATFVGAVGIGVAQSLSFHYVNQSGFVDAIPFLVIIVVLVITGRSLPLRSHVTERLPTIGSGALRWPIVAAFSAVAVYLMVWQFPVDWQDAFTVSFSTGVLLLSIVVLTGYAGQISLAQYALAGVGALVTARLMHSQGWPFWAAAPAGIFVTVLAGVIFAIPALRTRGVTLAVVTLGLGYAVQRMVFENPDYSGGTGGIPIGFIKPFGYGMDAIFHPARYGVFAVVSFVICALLVANLRRGVAGRRLIAIRSNERAAASLGISVVGAKIYAFGVAAAIAALAGILLGFRSTQVLLPDFSALQSIYAAGFAVIGGVGYIIGPLLGAGFSSGGYGVLFNHVLQGIDKYLVLIGGISVVVVLILHPDGVVPATLSQLGRAARRTASARLQRWWRRHSIRADLVEPSRERVPARALDVRNLTVRFGGVVAVRDANLSVAPGEIVGLIGPNGAGKTTLIDAVTGFVRPAAGAITIGDRDLTGLAPHRRVLAGVARSWQSLELFEDISVLENLQIAADDWHWRRGLTSLIRPGRLRLNPTAAAAVADFGLADELARKAADLPYGRRRLVGIARAVALSPSVLLLDEPAAGLSAAEGEELATLVRRLADDWGLGIILIEHDVELVLGLCDKVVVLDFGYVIASGTPQEVRANPAVIAAYLGGVDEPGAGDHPDAPSQ